jgi:hypothetical protein
MAVIDQEFCGANGLIYYGSVLLFVDNWSVSITSDTLDVTNISIYDTPNGLPNPFDQNNDVGQLNQPFPKNVPDTDLPWKLKTNNNLGRKQAQYGAARLLIDSGLRVAKITCSGLCGKYDEDTGENVMPRINNYVHMQFSNSIEAAQTLFNFPTCIVTEVVFDWNVRNYQRWTMSATSTGEFDVFPGTKPV